MKNSIIDFSSVWRNALSDTFLTCNILTLEFWVAIPNIHFMLTKYVHVYKNAEYEKRPRIVI